MNSAHSTNRFPAAVANSSPQPGRCDSEFSVSKIRTTQEDIENSGHGERCANCSIGRSPSKKEFAQSARRSSRTTAILSRTTNVARAWEEHGETTIQTTSKQSIGGAIQRRDHVALRAEGCRPISSPLFGAAIDRLVARLLCANGVRDFRLGTACATEGRLDPE